MPDPYAWSLDVDGILVVAVLVAAYAVGIRAHPAPRWRIGSFALGAALVLSTHVAPLASIANHYLLSAHLLQNVVLAEWAPALVVIGLPPTLAARLGSLRGAATLTHPAVALPVWLITYFAWHLPWAYDAALEHPATLLHLEHACYFAAGVLLWWPVFHAQPHRLGAGAKTVYLFAAFVLASPLGLLLALLPSPIYGFYADGPGLWGLSHLTDQQIAGVTMSVEQAVVLFVLCTAFFFRFLREEESRETFRSAQVPTSGSR